MNTEGRKGNNFSNKQASAQDYLQSENFAQGKTNLSPEFDSVSAKIQEIKEKHHLLEIPNKCNDSLRRESER